jgi:hypothetical protein
MVYFHLPNPPVPSLSFTLTLDSSVYVMDLRWSERSGWYLGIADIAGVPIQSPVPLVLNTNLLDGVTDPRKPPGILLAVGQGDDPGYEDLEVSCFLGYVSAAELAR